MSKQNDSTDNNPPWEVVDGGLLVNGKVYTKLNLACGVPLEKHFPEPWLNVDAEPGAADLVMSIHKLPEEWEGLFEEVRASHVLEHFTLNEAPAVMKEWSRVTAPGGKLRVCVPDLALFVEAYVNGNKDRKGREAVSVEHTTHMLTQIFGRGYEDREMNPFMRHHMVYDEALLRRMFELTGEAGDIQVYPVAEDPSQQFEKPIKNDASNSAYTLNMFMVKRNPNDPAPERESRMEMGTGLG
jgi:predicted SAM-dependent methyltransferase